MRDSLKLASAVVGILMCQGVAAVSSAQSVVAPPRAQAGPVGAISSFASGSLHGVVRDESGAPVAGAIVSAIGGTAMVAETDRSGRYEMRTLSPGSYVVQARLRGFTASRNQVVQVRSSSRTALHVSLRRAAPVIAASIGAAPDLPAVAGVPATTGEPGDARTDVDESELAWRLRHHRRSVLKQASLPVDVAEERWAGFPAGDLAAAAAQYATSFITDTLWSGEVNLLTSGSFDTPQQLFAPGGLSRGVAYMSISAPVGEADWTVRAAVSQADIASWIVAGSYAERDADGHHYDLGVSFSTQRYEGGSLLALRDATSGSRSVGELYGSDTFSLNEYVTVGYGAHYARYDYLSARNLVSPQVEVTLAPNSQVRFKALASRRAVAPGAEEFLPPGDTGLWLPPQRTFSALETGRPLTAQETTNAAFTVERDFGRATVGLRAFHQQSTNQLVTMFGAESRDEPAATSVGHYLVGTAGNARTNGLAVSVETMLSKWLRGGFEYSMANATLASADASRMVVLVGRPGLQSADENIHNLSAVVEATVPETSTRVLFLYRVSNAFAAPVAGPSGRFATRASVDDRFDLQVRQSLPFMNSSAAKWEMLLAVRNFFREPTDDQSIYDELLVVRPPKRLVGGILLRF